MAGVISIVFSVDYPSRTHGFAIVITKAKQWACEGECTEPCPVEAKPEIK